MAKKTNPKDAPADIDELLGAQTPETESEVTADPENFEELLSTQEEVSENEAPVETPEQRRIRELEAELAKPMEHTEKTPEQLRIEELEMQLAQRNAVALENAPEVFQSVGSAEVLHHIHIVEDGFNAFGRVWMRGQELRITQKDYEETKDRHGQSWIDTYLEDPHAQYSKWGRVYIAPGPFVPRPGEVFNDALTKEDARRRGAIPTVSR